MQVRKLLTITAFVIIAALSGMDLMAQEVLVGDADWPVIVRHEAEAPPQRTSGADSIPAPFPFLDDFSYDDLRPSSVYWVSDPSDERLPGVSVHKGFNVPSKGVISFDGATFSGRKYDDDLAGGPTDSLVSHIFDLSGKSIADSLYLSFFVQAGGTGEAPEASDSIVVYFDSTGNYDWVRVWSQTGSGISETEFSPVSLLLDTVTYFHASFRFKFVAFGSLNGEFDQWHVDYVYFDEGRTGNDLGFVDLSPSRISVSPFFPWTLVPHEQYVAGGYSSATNAVVRNPGSISQTATVNFAIDDPFAGSTFFGTTTGSATTAGIGPFGGDTVSTGPFTDQNGNMNENGAIRVTAVTSASGDTRAENDTVRQVFRVDSLIGYDDGVSDQSYGLTVARHFCQEYELDHPDTLTAVWINFSPTLHYNPTTNQSTCLDFKSFKLVVWDTLAPDSQLTSVSSGMNVTYDSSLNEFARYQLLAPVLVPETFWVGVRQSDGMPLGVGFDRQCLSGKTYFEDANGDFVLSSNSGCLMIRPEFAKVREPLAAAPTGVAQRPYKVQMFPNPLRGGPLTVALEGPEPLRKVETALYDLQGRNLFTEKRGYTSGTYDFNLRPGLPAAMYMVRINGQTRSGKSVSLSARIVIEN